MFAKPRLAIGDKIISHNGECDHGDEGPRETGRDAVGTVLSIDGPRGDQGYIYGVGFEPSDVSVFLDDSDFDNEPGAYTLNPQVIQ